MAVRIKPKRGSGVPNESQLQEHEIAMDVSTGTIYVGSSSTDAGTDCAVLAEKNAAGDDTYTDAQAIAAVEGEATLDLSGSVTIGGDLTGDTGDFNIANSVDGSDIVFKIDDTGGTTKTAAKFTEDDYTDIADATKYKAFLQMEDAGIKIGSQGEFSTTGDPGDNGEGDYELNGLVINPTGNSWPGIVINSTGESAGKNPVYDRYGAGSLQQFPNGVVTFGAANGVVGSEAALDSGKNVGQISFQVHDGNQYGGSVSRASATITSQSIETAASNNDRAVDMKFAFMPSGGDGTTTSRTDVVEMREDRVIFTPEGNEALRVDSEVKLGAPLNIDANAIEDDGNLVLEVDSGALKLYHNDDLRITTRQYDTFFENDVFTTSVFTLDATYPSRFVTSHAGVAGNKPSIEVGQEGTSVEDAIIDFSLFDGGNYNSDRTQRIARLNAYSGGASDNRMYLMLDDDGDLDIVSQIKNDAGDITHFNYGVLKVVSEHGSGGDELLIVEQNEPLKVFSGSSAYATAQFQHTLATADDNHTMVKFDVDFTDQTPYDVKFGFTAEVTGDNITGDDEGFCGRLDFEWKDNGNHEITFRADNYQDDVYHERKAIIATTSITEFNTMLKLKPITMGAVGSRPGSPDAGELYFNTTAGNLEMYTTSWQTIANERGMMFCNNSGVFHGYDGTNWKSFDMTAI